MKINFTSFLVTEALIYAALVTALADSCIRITRGTITISQALVVLMLSYSYFSSAQQLMSASHSALTAISAAGKVEEILDTDTSRPFDPLLPEDKEHFNGIRMENVSYGYKGRSKACLLYTSHMQNGTLPNRMCLGTFSRRARSLATCFFFARVRIIGTLVPFCVIGNFKEFPIT